MDNVKHRKATSDRLRRAFKIANMQATNALPQHGSTIALWIHEMFEYFEPEIQEEIKIAKSKIHVSFDGWGFKHKKLSVVSVIIHFINKHGDMVTRLIGLPELPNHKKAGVGKWFISFAVCIQLYFFS
jgi:hypothetical protein